MNFCIIKIFLTYFNNREQSVISTISLTIQKLMNNILANIEEGILTCDTIRIILTAKLLDKN